MDPLLSLVLSQARGLKFSVTTYENNLVTDSKFHKVILNSFWDMSICHTPPHPGAEPGLLEAVWGGHSSTRTNCPIAMIFTQDSGIMTLITFKKFQNSIYNGCEMCRADGDISRIFHG